MPSVRRVRNSIRYLSVLTFLVSGWLAIVSWSFRLCGVMDVGPLFYGIAGSFPLILLLLLLQRRIVIY